MPAIRKGDKVTWNSHGHETTGTVKKKITAETDAAGRHVTASVEDPQFEVESDKSGRRAVHKPSALKKKK